MLLWEMWNGVRAWAGMHQLQVIFNTTVKNKRLEFGEEAPAEYVVRDCWVTHCCATACNR